MAMDESNFRRAAMLGVVVAISIAEPWIDPGLDPDLELRAPAGVTPPPIRSAGSTSRRRGEVTAPVEVNVAVNGQVTAGIEVLIALP
jgi:hypothetical protein